MRLTPSYEQKTKILLNSLYGALLNEFCRFFDQRIGQSVTLTGRSIAKHMNSQLSYELIGEYNHNSKVNIYSDTDSCIFSIAPSLSEEDKHLLKNKENIIELYDSVANNVSDSFKDFMIKTFNCSEQEAAIIKCSRENIASRALFIKKKRYAMLVYDKEGIRQDSNGVGSLKAMGVDLKRSDTPKVIQDFLKNVLMEVLKDSPIEDILHYIKHFRREFKNRPGWEKGSPKKVNGLTAYTQKIEENTKKGYKPKGFTVPWQVQASINWNRLKKVFGDNYSMDIGDGQKIIICNLKPNTYGINSIAYPVDEPHLPWWFKELPFDNAKMEEKVIDDKLDNMIGVLNWNLNLTKESENFENLFEF